MNLCPTGKTIYSYATATANAVKNALTGKSHYYYRCSECNGYHKELVAKPKSKNNKYSPE